MRVFLCSEDDPCFGAIFLTFSSNIQYKIGWCTAKLNLPIQPPTAKNKIWRVAKDSNSLIITCNTVEVLVYNISSSDKTKCLKDYVVTQIKFSGPEVNGEIDTASDFYSSDITWFGKFYSNIYQQNVYKYTRPNLPLTSYY